MSWPAVGGDRAACRRERIFWRLTSKRREDMAPRDDESDLDESEFVSGGSDEGGVGVAHMGAERDDAPLTGGATGRGAFFESGWQVIRRSPAAAAVAAQGVADPDRFRAFAVGFACAALPRWCVGVPHGYVVASALGRIHPATIAPVLLGAAYYTYAASIMIGMLLWKRFAGEGADAEARRGPGDAVLTCQTAAAAVAYAVSFPLAGALQCLTPCAILALLSAEVPLLGA